MSKMKDPTRILVSFPVSGFTITIPDNLITLLGGIQHPVSVKWTEDEYGQFHFTMRRAQVSRLHIRQSGRGSHVGRILIHKTLPQPVPYGFAPEEIPWAWNKDTCTWTLPSKDQLRKPWTKTKKNHIPSLLREKKAKVVAPKEEEVVRLIEDDELEPTPDEVVKALDVLTRANEAAARKVKQKLEQEKRKRH